MAEEDKGERREVGHHSVKSQNFFTTTVFSSIKNGTHLKAGPLIMAWGMVETNKERLSPKYRPGKKQG